MFPKPLKGTAESPATLLPTSLLANQSWNSHAFQCFSEGDGVEEEEEDEERRAGSFI